MPDFDEAYQQYKDDIIFMMVNMTDGSRETLETASSFIADSEYSFPVYYDTKYSAARKAVQKGIQRAKAETEYQIVQPAAPKRSRKLWAALAAAVPVAATLLLFVAVNTNAQLAITAAENPTLKPVVEWTI